MTKLLDDALAVVRDLPTDEQDRIARAMLRLTGIDDELPAPLAAEERGAIATSKAAAARGEFANVEEIRSSWAKHGLWSADERPFDPPDDRVAVSACDLL